jgi:SAM-dependent methyltransferase
LREAAVSKPYQYLSQYYDEIFLPFRSPIDTAREHVLRRILPRAQTACDLACGTGTTALMLARRKIRVYAVDLSPQMCGLTREKARREGLPVRVVRADMRSFRLPEVVDLVLCEFDAVNHVPQASDLPKVAAAVHRALRPGGYFFFDVNNARAFKKYWTGTVWVERPGIAVVMRNGHSPQLDRAWVDIDLFVRERKHWLRNYERVEEVCWRSARIKKVFRNAGFDRLHTWDAAAFWKSPRLPAGCRTVYLARKAAG